MKEEMLPKLAQFFKDKGLMTRPEFRAAVDTPYTLREIERVFKNYSSMLYQVGQVKLPEAKVEPETVKPTVKKVRKIKTTREEDSLDG
jgi:hypothetical protein